jgi:hypothetical protein
MSNSTADEANRRNAVAKECNMARLSPDASFVARVDVKEIKTPSKKRFLIAGAAGRDFHDYNVYWRHRKDVRVVCLTAATQIPGIAGRRYPPSLAGKTEYPDGIPIHAEIEMEALIEKLKVTVRCRMFLLFRHHVFVSDLYVGGCSCPSLL